MQFNLIFFILNSIYFLKVSAQNAYTKIDRFNYFLIKSASDILKSYLPNFCNIAFKNNMYSNDRITTVKI